MARVGDQSGVFRNLFQGGVVLPFLREAVSLPLKILDLFGVSCLLDVGGVNAFEPCLPAAIFKLTNLFCLFFMKLFQGIQKMGQRIHL